MLVSRAIYVDDQLRFENAADHSGIDRPVSVFTHA